MAQSNFDALRKPYRNRMAAPAGRRPVMSAKPSVCLATTPTLNPQYKRLADSCCYTGPLIMLNDGFKDNRLVVPDA